MVDGQTTTGHPNNHSAPLGPVCRAQPLSGWDRTSHVHMFLTPRIDKIKQTNGIATPMIPTEHGKHIGALGPSSGKQCVNRM